METNVARHAKKAIEITVRVPWAEVEQKIDTAVDRLGKEAKIKGFRKGKAPKKIVREKVDQDKTHREVLAEIIAEAYQQALKQNQLKPIVPPKIVVRSIGKGQDWEFNLHTAEAPEVTVEGYKEVVKSIKQANPSIWVPGKSAPAKDQPEQKNESVRLAKIFEALLKEVKVELADILLEQETNRLLAQTLDELKSLGLSLESYLASTGKTSEQLRKEYKERAERTLKLEFILEAVSEKANIQVTKEEIDQFISEQKDKKAKDALRQDSYHLALILRRQKTVNHLLEI
jgi:FKBP-type peptidyl-prolyl cis-trans isomerase (trigger factor)